MSWAIWTKITALFNCITGHLRWYSPNKQQITHHVHTITHQLNTSESNNVKKLFIFPLRFLLPETILEKGWNILCKSFGPLESIGDPIISTGWLLTTVKVPLQFQRTEFGMNLLLSPWGGLLGLNFLSLNKLGLGPGWQAPAYADPNARETEMTLGKGRLKVGATLCLPSTATSQKELESKFPCVIFIGGSGPVDRDSTVEENKPFKDIALGLASHGIASIRFDKVAFTHRKAFARHKGITLTDEYVEHATDAVIQAQSHPRIRADGIYVLGHSLGAVVAPRIACMDGVSGCIIMAGPAEPIYWSFVRQLRYIKSLDGPESLYLGKQIEDAEVRAGVADGEELTMATPAKKLPFGIGAAYWLDYRRFEPIRTAGFIGKPVAVFQGERDYQVTVDDYEVWWEGLRGKEDIKFYLYKGLNHLFVSGSGMSTPLEYSVPGNVDKPVVDDLALWVSGNK
ncbi:hypothetical protein ASPVEDRAFT_146383 [Aspergillus versicolor CBS 583.65]|uniref:Serine aminopeptidase S33 domain-containing protein n=1 Tax=Aspergillus versicolor CBS 583.65 TaxID=1036611 RepID=A0A1L9P634_ASPVE|nr:uncharacterized protein ASPVEDRAFT_146383 [Aspergillus versicolor CBS 583.65]OJI96968.1 hypothetical protein ASPVEDRAFT_146383 [Aspergillus versicolor CBS 583.65]